VIENCEKTVEKTVEDEIWGHCHQKRYEYKFMDKLDFSMKIAFHSIVVFAFINLIKISVFDTS